MTPSPFYGWGYESGAATYHRVMGGPERSAMAYLCGATGPTAAANVAPVKADLPHDGFGGHACAPCWRRWKTVGARTEP